MTKLTMTKLSNIQLLLLSTAVARSDGSLIPPPETLGDLNASIRKSITALLSRHLVEEKPVEAAPAWREEDAQNFGIFITDRGRAAIGVDAPAGGGKPAVEAKPVSKIDTVLGLLRRTEGATLTELVEATGWLPHTTRAALTGLRKKGHDIARGKRGEASCYTLATIA